MATRLKAFDADAKTAELLAAPVTIGARTFHPARLTPDVRHEQIAIATRSAKLAREAGLSKQNSDEISDQELDRRVEVIGSIDEGVYEQLQVLLRDSENESRPAIEFLTEHLDHRVAGDLLGWLLQDEEDTQGEAQATPAATGP